VSSTNTRTVRVPPGCWNQNSSWPWPERKSSSVADEGALSPKATLRVKLPPVQRPPKRWTFAIESTGGATRADVTSA
jgi:hypothetical protein